MKCSIEDLERMMDMEQSPTLKPDGRIEMNGISFKYEIGDKVQNTAYGYNATVTSRHYAEYADGSKGNAYCVAIWESSPPQSGSDVLEQFLEKGHRIE